MKKSIAVFCGSHFSNNPIYADAAHEMGRLLAKRGYRLVYGGSSWGYMGVVAKACLEAGGEVTAVIPTIFSQEVIDSQPVTELVKVVSMAERKHQLALRSDAFIALCGGAGTLDEVTDMMTLNQLSLAGGMSTSREEETSGNEAYRRERPMKMKPIGMLNTNGFFDPFLLQLKRMTDEGLLSPSHHDAVVASSSPEELLELIEDFISQQEEMLNQ